MRVPPRTIYTPRRLSCLAWPVRWQAKVRQSARTQARQTFELLGRQLKSLPEAVRDTAQKLVGLEGELVKRARSIMDWKVTALRIRCHGNYHLGEVLYTGKDFVSAKSVKRVTVVRRLGLLKARPSATSRAIASRTGLGLTLRSVAMAAT